MDKLQEIENLKAFSVEASNEMRTLLNKYNLDSVNFTLLLFGKNIGTVISDLSMESNHELLKNLILTGAISGGDIISSIPPSKNTH